MEVSQFTYFQQVGGIDCELVAGELTYGLERLAMYVQGTDNGFELDFNGRDTSYGDVFHRAELSSRIIILRRHRPIFCCGILKTPRPSVSNWLKKVWPCRPMTSA